MGKGAGGFENPNARAISSDDVFGPSVSQKEESDLSAWFSDSLTKVTQVASTVKDTTTVYASVGVPPYT